MCNLGNCQDFWRWPVTKITQIIWDIHSGNGGWHFKSPPPDWRAALPLQFGRNRHRESFCGMKHFYSDRECKILFLRLFFIGVFGDESGGGRSTYIKNVLQLNDPRKRRFSAEWRRVNAPESCRPRHGPGVRSFRECRRGTRRGIVRRNFPAFWSRRIDAHARRKTGCPGVFESHRRADDDTWSTRAGPAARVFCADFLVFAPIVFARV